MCLHNLLPLQTHCPAPATAHFSAWALMEQPGMRHASSHQKTYQMRRDAERCISRPGWDSPRLLLSSAHPVSILPMPRCITGAFTQDASISAGD